MPKAYLCPCNIIAMITVVILNSVIYESSSHLEIDGLVSMRIIFKNILEYRYF